jgi:hypothetical protein
MSKRKKPTVAELQALLPVSLEDRLRGLVPFLRAQAERSGTAAATGMGYKDAAVRYRLKWFGRGRMDAFNEVASLIEALLDQE